MKPIPTASPEVISLEPKDFGEERGFFYEGWNERTLKAPVIDVSLVKYNHSKSAKNVLRGLHYQIQNPQGNQVRGIAGEVFDVAVDLRKSSPTFGRYVSFTLSAEKKRMVWIPPGFAHGVCFTSESAEFLYKTTDYWSPKFERTLRWNDSALKIEWPPTVEPT